MQSLSIDQNPTKIQFAKLYCYQKLGLKLVFQEKQFHFQRALV